MDCTNMVLRIMLRMERATGAEDLDIDNAEIGNKFSFTFSLFF